MAGAFLVWSPLICANDLSASAKGLYLRGAESSRRVNPAIVDVNLKDLPLAKEWQPGDPVMEVPEADIGRPRVTPPRLNVQVDPLLQRQAGALSHTLDPAFPNPIASFPGQGFSGAYPPDTVGDVGPNHYIQAVNHYDGVFATSVIVYDKVGSIVAGPFLLRTLGTGEPCASGGVDPVVLYDALAARWLLSEFTLESNNLCVYVSRTSDPVGGGWFRYQFTTTKRPDYPKYGVWPDAYYVATNEQGPNPDPAAYALDRTRMLQGLPATFQRFSAPPLDHFLFQALTPADLDGMTLPPPGAPGIFMRHRDDEAHNPPGTGKDFLEIWEFHVDWENSGNSTFSGPTNIPIADFSSELCGYYSMSCFRQPDTSNTLDPLRQPIMFRVQYRNYGTHQALAGNLVTDADGEPDNPPDNERGGIRWFELRKAGATWALFQEGTYSPDRNNRWMGSTAMDKFGNFAIGYSVSSQRTLPGIRYAGRLVDDTPGTLPQGEATLRDGSFSQTNRTRWGDYAAMNVDPLDDCTFWFTTEYMPTSNWGTWVGSFRFDACRPSEPAKITFTDFCDCITVRSHTAGGKEWLYGTWDSDCGGQLTVIHGSRQKDIFSIEGSPANLGLTFMLTFDSATETFDGSYTNGVRNFPYRNDDLYTLTKGVVCPGQPVHAGKPSLLSQKGRFQ